MNIEITREPPDRTWVERKAKLFEAGEYPDKGVSITVQDLSRLKESFAEPVPVLIEHSDSPLELGFLTAVEAIGNELFGTVSLSAEANALVEKSGARSLSLGLSPDLSAIREVSLVRNPRVATAQLYSGGPVFVAELPEPPSPNPLPPPGHEHPGKGKGAPDWQRRFHQLQRERREEEADRKVESFVAEGRLTPAQAPFARAILASEGAVEFDGESTPLAQMLLAIIQRQPPHAMFGERAPVAAADHSQHLMLPEEVAFYQRHFPGVSLEEIAKKRH